MRHLITRFGRLTSVVFVTLLSTLLSVAIASGVYILLGRDIDPMALRIAILAPLLIAPLMSWFIISLILEIHALEDEQRRLATYDSLTHVMMRRAYVEHSQALLDNAGRSSATLAVAIIDLDHFKSINDTYGHAAGDAVLTSFASLMRHQFREGDVLGRIGGEEFAITLPVRSIDDAFNALDELRATAESSAVTHGNTTIRYTISVGIADVSVFADADPVGDRDPSIGMDRMLACADAALYRAKHSGRNRVGCWTDTSAADEGPSARAA